MQQLGAHLRVERLGPLLDEPQAEVDVAEQAALLGRPEGRAAAQLADAPDVVQQRRGEQQIGAQPRVELRGLARQRRDADRVLEQAARVGVMRLGGRQLPQRLPDLAVAEEAPDDRSQAGMRQLRRRGTRGSRPARRRRGASAARGRPDPRRRPRPSGSRAGAGCRSSRRGRARARRRPRRSGRPAARRPSRSAPRSGRSSRPARASGTARPFGSSAAACGRRRRRLRPCGRPSARRWCSRDGV